MYRFPQLLSLALVAAPLAADRLDKVDNRVLEQLATHPDGRSEFLIVLSEQADLSAATGRSSKLAKGRYVLEQLSAVAARSQAPLLAELDAAAIPHRSYWIVNMIWAQGDLPLVSALAERGDVERIAANPKSGGPLAVQGEPASTATGFAPDAMEWNVSRVKANEVWALGYTGQGAVVAGQDTGFDWNHPALKAKYRGWNGSSATHAHNWHDAIHESSGICAANSTAPCDDDTALGGHGTHTLGTMVGDDGVGNLIGVAPGARWIGCRSMDDGVGSPASYAECYQWFVAPTDLAGGNPDPALAPDVINNSWSCLASEGCSDPSVMEAVVEAVRAAGIVTVQAAGNGGPSCATIDTPSAIYDASFTVGNTDANDELNSAIAYGSSRGPVTIDGSGRRKPDVAAPGTDIRSSKRGGTYGTLTGTSQAGPHVAGVVALMISADPALAGQVELIEELLRESTSHAVIATGSCGGTASTAVPNNLFGWGRIDARAAVALRLSGFLFRDGFESGLADDWSAVAQ